MCVICYVFVLWVRCVCREPFHLSNKGHVTHPSSLRLSLLVYCALYYHISTTPIPLTLLLFHIITLYFFNLSSISAYSEHPVHLVLVLVFTLFTDCHHMSVSAEMYSYVSSFQSTECIVLLIHRLIIMSSIFINLTNQLLS